MSHPRKLAALAAAALSAALFSPCAWAGDVMAKPGQSLVGGAETSFGLPGEGKGPWVMAGNITKKGLQVVAGAAVVMVIWSGMQFLTSMGDEDKVKKAKQTLIYALVGVIAALMGWAIIDLVNSISLN